MSFEVYVQWFARGEPAELPLAKLRDAFGTATVAVDGGVWQAWGSDFFVGESDAVTGVTVSRPATEPEFWATLFRLLSHSGGVFYFPGGGPMVADQSAVAHLPTDLLESLGQPMIATAGDQLRAAVEAA